MCANFDNRNITLMDTVIHCITKTREKYDKLYVHLQLYYITI